jgi:hypothetical protein
MKTLTAAAARLARKKKQSQYNSTYRWKKKQPPSHQVMKAREGEVG